MSLFCLAEQLSFFNCLEDTVKIPNDHGQNLTKRKLENIEHQAMLNIFQMTVALCEMTKRSEQMQSQ